MTTANDLLFVDGPGSLPGLTTLEQLEWLATLGVVSVRTSDGETVVELVGKSFQQTAWSATVQDAVERAWRNALHRVQERHLSMGLLQAVGR